MNPDRYARIKRVFHEASELDEAARARCLHRECADDDELRAEIVAMLHAHDRQVRGEEKFLEPIGRRRLIEATGITDGSGPAFGEAGARVGCYEVERLIARGGMGEVYLARRADAEFDKRVAIKVLHCHLASEGMLQRFHRERQVLASIDHPHVSRLIDGGTTDTGLPYLVMEFIDGRSILEHCDTREVTVRERVELFRTVCRAVSYAHQCLVIHRDIKPSNILVTAEGEVKLLDFGIARLLEDDGDPVATATLTRTVALTPAYCSPEQIRGATMSTATDVYSLGVVLYELLAGCLPYDLSGLPRYAAERIVCESEPPPPSAATLARQRRHELRGDLDTIVLMAMRKDPERRYATVESFIDDLDRYLDGFPVKAHRHSLGYRARKLVRRNKPQVAAGVVALAGAVVAVVGLIVGWARARDANHIAENERAFAVAARLESQGVVDFLERMMASASPYERGRSATLLELLGDAESLIRTRLGDQPDVEASVRLALARTYLNLLSYADAVPHLERSLRHFRTLRKREDSLAECLTLLGLCRSELSFTGEADPRGVVAMQTEALLLREEAFEAPHTLIAQTLRHLAIAIWAEAEGPPPDEVVTRLESAISAYGTLGLAETADAALAWVTLGHAMASRGDAAAAESAFRSALAVYEMLPSREGAAEVDALTAFGTFLTRRGRTDEAVELYERVRERSPEELVLPAMLDASWRLADIHREAGNLAEAWRRVEEIFELEYRALARDGSVDEAIEHTLGELRLSAQASPAPERVELLVELLSEIVVAHPTTSGPRIAVVFRLVRGAFGDATACGFLDRCVDALGSHVEADALILRQIDYQKKTHCATPGSAATTASSPAVNGQG